MRVRPLVLTGLALLAAGALGCATDRVSSYPPGTVFSCNSCNTMAQLPRGRLVPAMPPPAPLPAGPPTKPGPVVPPAPLPSGDPGARLQQPEIGENTQPLKPKEETPAQPVDVPQFAEVKPGVASGQKPFAEGLNWLKDKGYRTVLHVRAPGEDDTAARRQFEAKGFRYLSLEVSPQTLNREIVDQFNRIVGDPANRPLFVYDRDSSLAGGLWYLHFRIVDGLSNDKATAQAAALGLNPDADGGPHKAMWLALQSYLSMSKQP
jgi:protein tyrosine phosphatase (PTP) superfamily phosphohydrolase (DUF442 family)